MQVQIERINRRYVCWSGYYRMTETPSQLKMMEAHIRRRLRARLIGSPKRRRSLMNKLIKRGIEYKRAAKAAYQNAGVWRKSHSSTAEKAWSAHWFEQMGLKIISKAKLPHWQPLKVWIKPCLP